MLKKLAILGIIGPVLYLLHVVLGGALWEGYSHLQQSISSLSGSGAPDRPLIQTILYVYGACVLAFSVVAYLYYRKTAVKSLRVSMALFVAAMTVSFCYGFFPEDPMGSALTAAGLMHIVVTAAIVPLTLLAPLLAGIGFLRLGTCKGFAVYSFVSAGVTLIVGGASAYIAANALPFFGLFERVNIGAFELWIALLAVTICKGQPEANRQ